MHPKYLFQTCAAISLLVTDYDFIRVMLSQVCYLKLVCSL